MYARVNLKKEKGPITCLNGSLVLYPNKDTDINAYKLALDDDIDFQSFVRMGWIILSKNPTTPPKLITPIKKPATVIHRKPKIEPVTAFNSVDNNKSETEFKPISKFKSKSKSKTTTVTVPKDVSEKEFKLKEDKETKKPSIDFHDDE